MACLVLLLSTAAGAFDLILAERYLIRADTVQPLFKSFSDEGSTCHPPAGLYEASSASINLNFTSSKFESFEIFISSTSDHLLFPNPNYKVLLENSSQIVSIKFTCISAGWSGVTLDIQSSFLTKSVYWHKYCGESDKFDFSLVSLLIIAVVTVYISSYRARYIAAWQPSIEDDSDVLTIYHAYGFVFFASGTLLLLYFFKDSLKYVLEILICTSSGVSVVAVFDELTARYPRRGIFIPFIGFAQIKVLILVVFSFILVLIYMASKNWLLNNFFGLCLAYTMIKTIKIPDFKVGALLLTMTLLYDICWVYFSKFVFADNVMVAVATGIDLPIKLLFPHMGSSAPPYSCSMLGLGDLALPGLFLAFASRFDHINRSDYLNVLSLCYASALVVCGMVLVVFEHAQPALLFIAPALIAGMAGNAARRKEMKLIFKGLQPLSLVASHDEEEMT